MGKLIDVDEFLFELTHWKDKEGWYHDNRADVYHISEIKEVCEKLPEAVVRCENCEYWSKKYRMSDGKTARCNYFSDEENEYFEYTNHTDFCSNGERGSDE